ncbi:4-hydroxyphenylacetate 3-hydroxylase family protein [Flavimaricola marinus]|uniref:Anthranilate 3-monooxygenase oxygenase component n=1 Tax=Flavimaricola marinus TaxID=1819565 RepID=A0A238LCX8_9RHOB|nr:4-hydroxyphenylacetate 3-hydroxylase family protein [Flavimaricola marinus]SMY07539.1 Anthranilate 3-monooxygenase oxygenase component [Flavimaricola marinus]
MIRTGDDYRRSIQDNRDVYMNGERVKDVTTHPMFKPLVDIRARIYDMQHDPATADVMTVTQDGEVNAVGNALPYTQDDWWAKRRATDAVLEDVGGVVTRVGDETVGEMWSLYDGTDVLNEVDPQFAKNIETHIGKVLKGDPFHVSANTDPKGDRSLAPQDQDPDMLLHVVKETDAGIIVRGAKYETAAAYANQAFTKPTIANWGNAELSDYAVGFICDLGSPGLKFLCRGGFAGTRGDARDYPLTNRFDEVDTIVIFDNVLIPWENVLFYRHTKAASFIRATLHRYSAFAFVQRTLKQADQMIGTALFNARQTGLEKQPAVQEKLSQLAIWREGINAHLTASIALAERSPAGLMMPNQSLMMTGRCHALNNLPAMMHIARELCGGQICVTPNVAMFENPETKPWMDKYYTINDRWVAEDRRKLLAFARDLLNSDYAGHRLTFQLFAQSPPFAQSGAVYRNFDWDGPLNFVKNGADLSDRVMDGIAPKDGDSAVLKYYGDALRKAAE